MDDRKGSSKFLDPVPNPALRWAKTSRLRAEEAIDDLDLALHELRKVRSYPAPEWREVQRLMRAAISLLAETIDEE